MNKVKVYDIVWDTDGEDIDLPKTITLDLDQFDAECEDELVEQISDYISYITGFCHKGFKFNEVK